MINKIKRAYQAAPIATIVLAISLVIAIGFSVRIGADAIKGPPPPKDVEIEAWMTPRYIARTWRIPPREMGDLLDLEKRGGRPDNLQNLADKRGVSVEALIEQLEADIRDVLAERQEKRERDD